MRIAIDARFYGPLGKGLGRYTQRLIENLEKVDFKNQYIIFLRKEGFSEYEPKNPNFKKVLADYPWYGPIEQIMMPLAIKKTKADLVHFPHFNVPIFYRGKFIVTIHDLILLQFPTKRATTLGPLLYKFKYWGYETVIRSAIKRAKKIITVSLCTKNNLIKHFNIDPEKIFAIYEAADTVETGQLKIPETDLSPFGIKKPYLLYVGNAYPHKNLEGLLKIFKKMKNEPNFNYQLVLVGKEDYFYNRLKKEAEEMDLVKTNILSPAIFFGFASQPILADLYRNASLYIFPSFVEGFGLPALEAMSYGLPVIASNSSCLPEILGEAALYFNPSNEKEFSDIIRLGLTNEILRKELIKNGHEQIKKYSWQKCAQETLITYAKAFEK
jgi:glycosyltransferase involved in cell wall biosynthesis